MAKSRIALPPLEAALLDRIVIVRGGFARNFLMPRDKARRATAADFKAFELDRAAIEQRNEKNKIAARKVADKIDGQTYVMIRQAGETGQLYGTVTARDIAEAVQADGGEVERSHVVLNAPIKTLGVHDVPVRLHAEVSVTVKINIARSAGEAERQTRGEAGPETRHTGGAPSPGPGETVLAELVKIITDSVSSRTPLRLQLSFDGASPTLAVESEEGDALGRALAEARKRGAEQTARILRGSDMLSADAFGHMLGITREAVRQKKRRHEVLGLQGAKRGVRYPRWQVLEDGRLLPALPDLFITFGDDSWAVFRFLTQPNPATLGQPPLTLLQDGEIQPVLAAAQSHARGDFG